MSTSSLRKTECLSTLFELLSKLRRSPEWIEQQASLSYQLTIAYYEEPLKMLITASDSDDYIDIAVTLGSAKLLSASQRLQVFETLLASAYYYPILRFRLTDQGKIYIVARIPIVQSHLDCTGVFCEAEQQFAAALDYLFNNHRDEFQ